VLNLNMRNSVFNLRNLANASPVLGKLIASSLLLGVVGTLGITASTQASTARPTTSAQTVAQANIAKQMQGQWQAGPIRFIFGSDGKLFIVFPAPSGPAKALQLRYRVNPSTRPMHLDLITSDNRAAQTIFEFTAARKMRVQLQGTNPGRPRPSAFGANATMLEKVSDATSLPPNTQVQPGSGNTPIPQ
jgi:hypothetical protein